jgi:fatty-acyl-CoA synthase
MFDDAHASYSCGATGPALLGLTIGEMLGRVAATHPERLALVDVAAGRRWSFAELAAEVGHVARGLAERGVRKGDRVGIWAPNRAEWVFTQYATAKIGAILVNINPSYRVHEVEYVIAQSGLSLMISATAFKDSDYAGMLARLGFDDVVLLDGPGWTDLIEAGRRSSVDLEALAGELAFDDAINIQYTSGTTGFPKGATLSHHNILNNGFLVGENLRYTPDDRVCLPVPLYHCFGMVMGILGAHSHGAAVVLPAASFDPAWTLDAVATERCTSLYGVPTMFIAELGLPGFRDYDLSSLRTGIMAGSPCPVEVMERVVSRMHMTEVAICYGMTETSPVSTMTLPDDDLHTRTRTIGTVMPHTEVKIVDADGRVVPRGTPGELCTRGYPVMLGYWNEPGQTAGAIDSGRWMHTGDIATMDAAGRLSIVGREKDMVIRGGENLYPREIEEFFHRHPDIADVQVIGVPDERYGEELMAWVIMRDGARALTADDLRRYAQGSLARHKIPRYVHVVDEFPMTVTGKVRKVDMRAAAVQLLTAAAG